jgi:ribosomal protein L37AE/L43A
MPKSRKINLETVQASLDTTCPKCEKVIPPAEMQRIDFERLKCPGCGELFAQGGKRPIAQ